MNEKHYQLFKLLKETDVVKRNILFQKKWLHPAAVCGAFGLSALIGASGFLSLYLPGPKLNPFHLLIFPTGASMVFMVWGFRRYDRRLEQNEKIRQRAEALFRYSPNNTNPMYDFTVDLLLDLPRPRPFFWQRVEYYDEYSRRG